MMFYSTIVDVRNVGQFSVVSNLKVTNKLEKCLENWEKCL